MLGRRLLAAVGLLAVTVSGMTVEAQEAASGAPGRPVVYRFEASIMGGLPIHGRPDFRRRGSFSERGPFEHADLGRDPRL